MSEQHTNSENDNLSGEVDITGILSINSSDTTDRTSDDLSDVSDVTTPSRLVVPTSQHGKVLVSEGKFYSRTDEHVWSRINLRRGVQELKKHSTSWGAFSIPPTWSQPTNAGQQHSRLPNSGHGDGGPGRGPSRVHGGFFHLSGHPSISGITMGRIPDPKQHRDGCPRELPFRVFQNLYRMKTAPLSTELYYFQGGRWLSSQLDYAQVPSRECVLITAEGDIYPHDRPRQGKPEEVTVAARMPDPIVHYCARTVSSSSSPRAWGSRIANKGVKGVIRTEHGQAGTMGDEATR
ncbi:hypothetical protein TIFTF001_018638 [Ficus carica]|uniref:Uncharacterized protein n=1 Tax=Ficus carica TaxID=3494 RepID=A0AA88D9F5_FICCA|nr:hypothetical protein TIFTF001_018638 [Ficus carica]